MSPNPPPGLMMPGVAAAPTVTESDAAAALVIRREILGSAAHAVGRHARIARRRPSCLKDGRLGDRSQPWPARRGPERGHARAASRPGRPERAGFQGCMSRNSDATTRVSSPTVKAGSPRAWRISAECQNCSWAARHPATEVNPSPSPTA